VPAPHTTISTIGLQKRKSPCLPSGLAHDGREFSDARLHRPFSTSGPCSTLCLVARKHSSRDRDFGSAATRRPVPFLICAFCSFIERFERAPKSKKETKSRYGRKKKKGSNLVCVCVLWVCMRSTNTARSEKRASPFFFTRLAGLEEDRHSNCSRALSVKSPGAPSPRCSSGSGGDGDKKTSKSNLDAACRYHLANVRVRLFGLAFLSVVLDGPG